MHIILTTNYSPWSAYSGGGQKSTHNIAAALTALGHDVEVIYTKSFFEKVAIPYGLPYKQHWALLPALRTKRASWLRNLSIFSVRNKVKELVRPETVIHSNGEEGTLIPTAKRKDNPFIITSRYPNIPEKVTPGEISVWSSFLKAGNTKYYLLGKTMRKSDLLTLTSKHTLNMLKKHYSLDHLRSTIIPNGVDKLFLQCRLQKTFNHSLIFFGRLAPSKGVDVLLDAMKLIKNKKLSLIIIGRGELEQKLKQQAQAIGSHHDITFKPWMDIKSLISALEESSYAVLPSREESFGNTMAEAMATGTPVISTTAGSIPEVVKHQKTGLLVPPNNPKAIANAIEYFISNPDKAAKIGRNARERVKNHYTWPSVAQQYERQYRILLEGE